MERVNKILEDGTYLEHIEKIKSLEIERRFCKHDITHFLDVCRIAWILNLENHLGLEKEIIYAAGLLHDIGRWVEYNTGEDHALVSAELCKEILVRCNYNNDEITMITKAIKDHRIKKFENALCEVIYKADKLSRKCFSCEAIGDCKKFKSGEKYYLKA